MNLPLLSKAFRPLFWLAAIFAVLAVPIWLLALHGGRQPGTYFGAMQWHAHEMLFGFAAAVIAGFLLTAVSNWTERETAVGLPLALLCGLWLLGRISVFRADQLPRWAPAIIDVAFLPAVALFCARPILATKNRRNYPFPAVLLLLGGINAMAHAGALWGAPHWIRVAHWVGVDCVVLLMLVITGRVIPMFTRNATGVSTIRAVPVLNHASAAAMLLVVVLDASSSGQTVAGLAAGVAGVLALSRTAHWGIQHTLRHPLLWVLHIGQLWIPLGLLWRFGAALTPVIPLAGALHALTAGAMGTLILGMMARVSLGHTGRMLAAPPSVAVAFGLVIAGGLARVLVPFLPTSMYLPALVFSGLLWSLSYATFLAVYTPILFSARVEHAR